MLLGVEPNATIGITVATSSNNRRPSFCPPASATTFLPSRDRAWQPTQVPPVSWVPMNFCAWVCVCEPKSKRMMPVSPDVVQ